MLDASRNPQLWPRRVPVPPPLGHGLYSGMTLPPERHPEATVLLPSPVRWRAVLPKRGQQRSFRHAARLYDAPRWELGATRPSRIRPCCLGGGLLLLHVQVLKRHRRGQLSRSPLKLVIFVRFFSPKQRLKTTTNKQQQQFVVDKITLTTNNNSGIPVAAAAAALPATGCLNMHESRLHTRAEPISLAHGASSSC
eukprot:scaffold133305_cov71-Phaeocystis_antarctica.AAC.4